MAPGGEAAMAAAPSAHGEAGAPLIAPAPAAGFGRLDFDDGSGDGLAAAPAAGRAWEPNLCDCGAGGPNVLLWVYFCEPCAYGDVEALRADMAAGTARPSEADRVLRPGSILPCLAHMCVPPALATACLVGTLFLGFNAVACISGAAAGEQAMPAVVCASYAMCVTGLFLGKGAVGGHTRNKIRQKYGIEGSLAGDMCTAACCGPCATCQEATFLRTELLRGCGAQYAA